MLEDHTKVGEKSAPLIPVEIGHKKEFHMCICFEWTSGCTFKQFWVLWSALFCWIWPSMALWLLLPASGQAFGDDYRHRLLAETTFLSSGRKGDFEHSGDMEDKENFGGRGYYGHSGGRRDQTTTQVAGGLETLRSQGGLETLRRQGGLETLRRQGGLETLRRQGGLETLRSQGGLETLRSQGGLETLRCQRGLTLRGRGGQGTLRWQEPQRKLRCRGGGGIGTLRYQEGLGILM